MNKVQTIEKAAMNLSLPVRMAKFFIAHRLVEYNKKASAESKKDAATLLDAVFKDITPNGASTLGFPPSYFTRVSPYATIAMGSSQFKSATKKNVVNNPKFSKEEGDVLYQSILFLERENVSGMIDKIIGISNRIDPKFGAKVAAISSAFDAAVGRPKTDIKALFIELSDIVKKITGKPGNKAPQDQLKKFKTGTQAQAAPVYNYNSLRRRIATQYDADLAAFIAKQDKTPYVHEVYAHTAKLGYEIQKVIKADKKIPLKVNVASGKIVYLTDDGRVIDGGIPSDAIKVTFAKTYDPATGTGAYLSYTTDTAAGVTRKYTLDHKSEATKSKFDKADNVSDNIAKYVTKWTRDLSSRDDTVAMAATVCMLIYKTGMRVGTKVGSRAISGEVAYGALTLLARQLTIGASKITLKYKAKKQVDQMHVIPIKDKVDKLLLRNLKDFKVDKGPDDLVFSYTNDRGTVKRLTPQQLNAYLKSMGYTAGIHKIRHVRGTNLAISLLNSVPRRPAKDAIKTLAKKQASAETYIKTKILEPVANLRGHKSKDGKPIWSTSISNYLNPKPFIKWFTDQGLRVPKWVPKTAAA